MTISVMLLLLGVLSVVAALYFAWLVARIPATQGVRDEEQIAKLLNISEAIRDGANAFLAREYRYMLVFIVVFGVLVWAFVDTQFYGYPYSALSFVAGALISILAGYQSFCLHNF